MPTRGESTRLGLAEGTPVAEHVRTSWSADGTPVRVQVCVLPGDRNVVVYELDEQEAT
jgi:GntR family transcriptional regulator